MKFLSDILAKAGLTVDGVVTLNNTATGQTPASNDNSTKLATTAWVRTFVQPYSLPIASTSILGGIKVGTGLSIDAGSGILSVTGGGAASIKSTQTFTATAAQTVFTITGGYSVGLIDVFLNGVYLSPNQTTATNGTSITLGDAALAGDIIDVIVASPVYEGATTTTDQLSEGTTNLYFTNARARAAISETVTGLDYNSSTGVLSITTGYGIPTTASQTTWDAAYNDKINSAAVTGTTTKTLTLTQQDGGTVTATWTDDNTDAVTSVFGRTGVVVAVSGDYTTTLVTEGTNLYYTDARSRAAISVTGSGSYDSATGIITVTGGVTSVNTLTGAVVLTTTNIAEGTNLYYTQARFDTAFTAKSTTNLTEGTNLYYTSARANADFDTRLATKSTSNLSEGTNLYYTDTRVGTYLTNNSYATQTYVNTAVSNLVDAAPGTLDTLNELAAALGDDPNFATTVATSIGTKEPAITAGTTGQYWRGDKSWQTLPVYTLSGLGGVPTTRTITINGTAQDLSADRTFTINSMVYPGAGIALSTGSAWGTSITDNSANWNTAFGWGNHASGGYLTTASAASTYVSLSGSYANPSWITSLAYSKITGVPAFITSYTEVDTLATVTGRGNSTTSSITVNGDMNSTGIVYSRANQTTSYTTAALWTQSFGSTLTGIAFHISGVVGRMLYMNTTDANLYWNGTALVYNSGTWSINVTGNAATATNVAYSGLTGTVPTWNQNTTGSAATAGSSNFLSLQSTANLRTITSAGIYREEQPDSGFYYTTTLNMNSSDGRQQLTIARGGDGMKFRGTTSGSGDISWSDWRNVWHSSNLTNLNQLTNGPGYITGYTETDTLATVVARGSSTSSSITTAGIIVSTADVDVRVNRGRFQVWNNAGTGNLGYRIRTDEGGGWRWQFVDGGNTEYFGVAYSTGVLTLRPSSGTIIERGGFTDFIGYNASYGSYIGGGVSNGSNYLYAGGYFYDGSTIRTLIHSGNIGSQSVSTASTASTVTHYASRDDGTSYNVVWAAGNPSHMYSCDAVRIQSSTGTIFATRSAAPMSATVASGNWDTSFSNTPVSTMAWGGDISSGGPTGTWWFQMNMRHSNASNIWGTQLAYGWEDNANQLYQRNVTGGNWSGWVRYLNSGNYSSYALPLSGGTVTGTVTINGGGAHPLAISSSQRYQMQVRNTGNSINSGYGWWWFMDTNFNMGFHADGAADRFTLTRDGNLSVSGTLSASNFSGASSGTNTGDQTNISGTSEFANQLKWYGAGATVTNANTFQRGILSNYYGGGAISNIPENGYGSLYNFGGYDASSLSLQLYSTINHNSTSSTRDLYYRMGNNLGFANDWRKVWDSVNLTNLNQLTNGPGYITGASYVAGLNLQGLGSGSMNVNNGGSAVYRNENGSGGNLSYAPVLHLGGGDTMWQIQGDYYDSSTLKWRAGYQGSWHTWRTIIHSGNIGSQSVSYASTSGTAGNITAYTINQSVGTGNSPSFAAITINGQTTINRHIDANTGWGSASGNTIFVGWSGGKVVLGSNANGGHDYASGITVASVVSTNPFFCFQDITAYSDARVKDNIQIVENAVEKIKAIRGVTYTRSDNVDKVKRHAGVLAQEVLKVLPEVVNGSEDSVYSVAYGNMAALFIEAIKEQQTQIESQKSEIDVLKDLVQQLINR
jgi:hypothetical protein